MNSNKYNGDDDALGEKSPLYDAIPIAIDGITTLALIFGALLACGMGLESSSTCTEHEPRLRPFDA